jgi:hypothetical protein
MEMEEICGDRPRDGELYIEKIQLKKPQGTK